MKVSQSPRPDLTQVKSLVKSIDGDSNGSGLVYNLASAVLEALYGPDYLSATEVEHKDYSFCKVRASAQKCMEEYTAMDEAERCDLMRMWKFWYCYHLAISTWAVKTMRKNRENQTEPHPGLD